MTAGKAAAQSPALAKADADLAAFVAGYGGSGGSASQFASLLSSYRAYMYAVRRQEQPYGAQRPAQGLSLSHRRSHLLLAEQPARQGFGVCTGIHRSAADRGVPQRTFRPQRLLSYHLLLCRHHGLQQQAVCRCHRLFPLLHTDRRAEEPGKQLHIYGEGIQVCRRPQRTACRHRRSTEGIPHHGQLPLRGHQRLHRAQSQRQA